MKKGNQFRMNRRVKAAIFAVLLCIAMAACGSASHKDAYLVTETGSAVNGFSAQSYDMKEESYYVSDSYGEMAEAESGQGSGSGSGDYIDASADYGKKLIRTYYLRVQTQSYDELYSGILARISESGGYVESSDEDSYDSTRRHVSLVIRIPADQADGFLQYLGDNGHVLSRNESTEDLTLTYYDLDSRLQTYKNEIEHLEELASRAENITELLEIERMIADLRAEVESYQSRLNHIDNKVNYSTINLDLSETQNYTYVAPTFLERIGEGLRGSLDDIGDMIVDFIVAAPVFLVGLIMFLIPVLLIVLIVFLIVRAVIRSGRKKTARKVAERSAKMTTEKAEDLKETDQQ